MLQLSIARTKTSIRQILPIAEFRLTRRRLIAFLSTGPHNMTGAEPIPQRYDCLLTGNCFVLRVLFY